MAFIGSKFTLWVMKCWGYRNTHTHTQLTNSYVSPSLSRLYVVMSVLRYHCTGSHGRCCVQHICSRICHWTQIRTGSFNQTQLRADSRRSNLTQEDQQRVRDRVILLGSIYHLSKSTAYLLPATYILPTQSPNLCIVNQSCCVSAAISPELETERGCAGREESCSAALWLIYEATFCGCGRWRPIRPWARVSPGVFVFRGVSGARWCFTMGLMKSSSASNTQAMRWALNARLSRLCHQKFAFASIYFSKMVLCRKILDGTHVEI